MARTGDTIAAPGSPPGRAARAIVRVSGPDVPAMIERWLPGAPRSRGVAACALKLGDQIELPVLALRFCAPASYTGEDTLELLVPGSPHLVRRIMDRLLSWPGPGVVRGAEPGEFSARAYLAGRLSLEQAEGVAATIAARSAADLKAAGELLSGIAGDRRRALADELALLLALVEAGIDFTDQEDVVAIAPAELRSRLESLRTALVDLLSPGSAAVPPEHVRAVLVGAPSAGKSTLFNALLGRARAVTSAEPGTTRDAIAEELVVPGELSPVRVMLIDAPGLDAGAESASARAAQARAREVLAQAEIIVHCDPSGVFVPVAGVADGAVTLRVRTKADVPSLRSSADHIAVCALDGWNIAAVARAIAEAARGGAGNAAAGAGGAGGAGVLPRHGRALRGAIEGVSRALEAAESGQGSELIAGWMRTALDHLGELTGKISPDDVIGKVFAAFCVGK